MLVKDYGIDPTSITKAEELARLRDANPCFIFRCGHNIVKDEHRQKTMGIRIIGVCDKCRNYEEARKAGRKRMGLFVGSDRAEYAADKKRNEASKKKESDEMSAGIKVGDIVTVSALPSCKKEVRPKLPAKGKIIHIDVYPDPDPCIIVEIDGKRFRAEKEMLILT